MLEQYGFLCDCVACSLTGEERRKNDEGRRQVLRMDSAVEKLLYDFDETRESDNTDQFQDLENKINIPGLSELEMQGEERDVANAVILLFHKLSMMDSLGFKVVSQASTSCIIFCLSKSCTIVTSAQLAVVSYILEVCREWELNTTALSAIKTGLSLAARIYGRKSHQFKRWSEMEKSFQTI